MARSTAFERVRTSQQEHYIFVSYNNCVFIVSSVAILGYNICVCHLLSNKEISYFCDILQPCTVEIDIYITLI